MSGNKKILSFIKKNKDANISPNNNCCDIDFTSKVKLYNKSRIIKNKGILCYAPHSNIYFAIGGKIGTCVCKRTKLYGLYPETTLKDAWCGKKRAQLKNIEFIDPLSRCFTCQTEINEKDYFNILSRWYDKNTDFTPYPQSANFELSNLCNLKCLMCSKEFSSRFETNEEFIKKEVYDERFLKELEEFIPHLKHATFIGGEPFLIDLYYKIWDLFAELNPGCELSVNTNGTILNNKVKDYMSRGNFNFFISIDSINKTTYGKIRKGANFEKTMENFEYFLNYSKEFSKYFGLFVCFMRQNWQEIPEIIDFANKKNISITFNRVWYPTNCALWNSNSDILNRIIKMYKKVKFKPKTNIEKLNQQSFQSILNLSINWKKKIEIVEKDRLIYEKKTDNDLIALLIIKINSFIEYHKFDNKEILELNKEIFSKIEDTEDTIKRKQIIIAILSTPLELIYTSIYFSGGIDLVVNYENI
jgi:molybdenum cofactor biosynthesis enzyme MoaA